MASKTVRLIFSSSRIFLFTLLGGALIAGMPGIGHAQEDESSKVLELKKQIIQLQNEGELGFRNLSLCGEIKSFGSYTPLVEPKVSQGSKLQVYYEPKNVTTKLEGGLYTVEFVQDLILEDADGKGLYEGKDMLNFKHLTRSPALDIFATNDLSLGQLPPGIYTLRLTLRDVLGSKTADTALQFEIIPAS